MTPMQIAKRASLRKLSNLISPVPADIDVAQSAATVPIRTIAAACGLSEEDYEPYGHFKAKLSEKIGPKLQAERDEAAPLKEGPAPAAASPRGRATRRAHPPGSGSSSRTWRRGTSTGRC